MADIKISELPTATSVNDADIFVMDQGLVTKTATRTQILASIKDANNNITANAFFNNLASITASGTPVVLTVASAPSYLVTGSGGQTIKLPDATTLQNGVTYRFNNNQSSGAISVNNNSNTLVASIPSGGFVDVSLLDNSIPAGSWERHVLAPSNVSWSTNTFDYPGSITSATWNSNAVAVNRGGTGATSAASALTSLGAQAALTSVSPLALSQGGTGATSQAAALIALAAMATSERANYIPTTQLGSLATTAQLAAITPASIGAMATSERATYATTAQVAAITAASLGALSTAQAVTIGQGGTGQTTQQAALNAIAGAVTANQVLKGNGTNVVLGALTSADIPTLPIAKLAGVAASGANTDLTSVALTTGTVSTTPSGVSDIVNKPYADSIGSGVNFHDACDYGTLAALSPTATYNQPGGAGVGVNATLTGQTNTALQVDGVTVAVGKRILVKNQASAFQNGVYNVTQQGDGSTVPYILTRASDYDTSGSGINEVQAGDFILILSSTLANTAWVQQTPAPINFGVTSISFIQFAAAAAGVSSFNTSLTGLTPSTNTTGAVTLAGTLGVASGGTGQTTQQAAINALAGAVTANRVLKGDGTNVTLAALTSADIPTLNQNTTGTAANVTGVVSIANGGTGQSTQQAALNAISGTQTTGYHFRSDGTNVSLQPMTLADVTAGALGVVYGGTGATTQAAALTSLGAQPALTTAAPLALSLGGTGQITKAAAFNALSPITTTGDLIIGTGTNTASALPIGTNGQVLTSNGTTASWVTGSGVAGVSSISAGATGLTPNTATTGAVTLAGTLALANGGTGATSAGDAISSLGVGMRMIEAHALPSITGTMNTGVTPNTFTVTATGVFTADGYTPVLGDIIAFIGNASTQAGFWKVTTLGAVGVQAVFERPSWFSGTAKNTMALARFGATQGGWIYLYIGPQGNADINVGTTTIGRALIATRTNNATIGANTFVNTQILAAGSTTLPPLRFQTGSLLTSLQAGAVEWDGSTMYLTNSGSTRNALFYQSGGAFTGQVSFKTFSETGANPSVSAGSLYLDLSTGSDFVVSLNQNITSFTLANIPTLNAVSSFTLELVQDSTGGRTVAWSFAGKTLKWANAVPPTQTLTANKSDVYTFRSRDYGSTYYGFVKGQNF